MDTTTKNKVIADFMGVIWYDSFVECREKKLDLFELKRGLLSQEGKTKLWSELEATYQWKPEYHTSYDRLIPVMRKLCHEIGRLFGLCEFLKTFLDKAHDYLWNAQYEKRDLFDHLYETIIHFNQLTKNATNQSQTEQAQQPERPV